MPQQPNVDDPRPPHQQVADDLRESIASGGIGLGERLPSVRELVVRYDVTRGVIQQALRILEEEGTVASWREKGTFVPTVPDMINAKAVERARAEIAVLRQQVEALQEDLTRLYDMTHNRKSMRSR